jgi:hypothetical protein
VRAATILWGDEQVPILQRNWQGQNEPYRYVVRLNPGEKWLDAKVSSNPQNNPARERYVQLPEGSVPPAVLAVRELVAEGASLAVWTDCWSTRAVFMSSDLVCVQLTGELWEILQKIKAAMGNRWSGLPDAIATFPNGRIVMRDMKFVGKDKLTKTQHAVVEWGHIANQI